MAQFKAFDESVEVNGETVLTIVDGAVMKDKALKILKKSGIASPAPGQWYPQQAYLNAFKDIAENIGPRMLHAIGSKIPDNAVFPMDDIDSVESALNAIDIAYHMNHRNGKIGRYTYEPVNGHVGRMICKTPYPCDFERGLIQSMAMRYLPRDSILVNVEHAHDSGCRKDGDDTCIYEVSW